MTKISERKRLLDVSGTGEEELVLINGSKSIVIKLDELDMVHSNKLEPGTDSLNGVLKESYKSRQTQNSYGYFEIKDGDIIFYKNKPINFRNDNTSLKILKFIIENKRRYISTEVLDEIFDIKSVKQSSKVAYISKLRILLRRSISKLRINPFVINKRSSGDDGNTNWDINPNFFGF